MRQRSSAPQRKPDSHREEACPENRNTSSQGPNTLVIIPTDYETQGVVPIVVRTKDDEGNRVYRAWIDAVQPVADKLRHLARKVLGDVAMVSEITETSVHGLSARHGNVLPGPSPSGYIYEDARWIARDILAGGWRRRKGYDTRLTQLILETLVDPNDFEKIYENRDLVEKLMERLQDLRLPDVAAQVHLYLSESEQAAMDDAPPSSQAWNTASHRFFYSLRKAVKLLERRSKGR